MTTSDEKSRDVKKFTGKKALIWIVSFFLVIFTVNGIMTYFALGTWGGLQTTDSYRKGIFYNDEIAAAEAQANSGWKIILRHSPERLSTPRGPDMRLDVEVSRPANDLPPVKVTALVTRAVTNIHDQRLILTERADGLYTAPLTLPEAGQWNVTILVRRADDTIYQLKDKIMVAAAD